MKQELISIIIPVYNAETFLPQCLDSVLKQTYTNFEVICVDDASSDNSFKILKDYVARDSRLSVFTKSNEGVSRARNFGINKAKGNLIMFVDADDWIDENTCKKAYEEMLNTKADVVMWGYTSEFSDHSSKKLVYSEHTIFDTVTVKQKLWRRFIGIIGKELAHPEKADSLCSVWGKLYKKNLIVDNEIRFIDLSEIGTYEDGMFNLQIFQYVKSAAYMPESLYHYRRTNDNSQTTKYRENLPEQWDHLFDLMQAYINTGKLGEVYQTALNNRIALSILGLGLNIKASGFRVGEQMKLIKKIIKADRYQKASAQLEMKYFPIHWKLFYGSAAHGLTLNVYLMLTVIRKIIYG